MLYQFIRIFFKYSQSIYSDLNQDADKQLTDYAANLFYSLTSQMDIWVEYSQGECKVFDGCSADIPLSTYFFL
ncbi:hypothetical protein EA756_06490 [Acinetobacter lactucae]|uniref:Uncharacterized protein n=1 Tax=Acinetobacter lactucae TaxID=1785128 RepID=A0A3R9S4T2_9GAMM|nr:hypothetical protein EA756_06490 [Acinetobacter lactucae]